jgi:hypothetical protein
MQFLQVPYKIWFDIRPAGATLFQSLIYFNFHLLVRNFTDWFKEFASGL